MAARQKGRTSGTAAAKWLKRVTGTKEASTAVRRRRRKDKDTKKARVSAKRKKSKPPKESVSDSNVPSMPVVGADYGAMQQQPFPPQMADPFQQAVAAVNQARTNPKYRHLLDARQRCLNMMTSMRLPEAHQTGTPMDIPVLSLAEAYHIHNRMPSAMSTRAAAQQMAPSPIPASVANAPMGGPARLNEPPDSGYGPAPRVRAGEPIVVHEKSAPRDSEEIGVFLEKAVQNEPDDVFREVAFRIIDDAELQVADPSGRDVLALHNPAKKKTVHMNVDEFKAAVAFIVDPKEPVVEDLPEKSKTIELLELMNSKRRSRLHRYFFPTPPENTIPDSELASAEEIFQTKVALQAKVQYLREKLRPLTLVRPVTSWWQTLSLGY